MSILGSIINENLFFFLLRLWCQDDSDRIFCDIDFNIGGDFQFDPVLLDSHYGSMDSACSDNLISGFKLFDHFLMPFLLGALRANEEKIENNKHKNKRE